MLSEFPMSNQTKYRQSLESMFAFLMAPPSNLKCGPPVAPKNRPVGIIPGECSPFWQDFGVKKATAAMMSRSFHGSVQSPKRVLNVLDFKSDVVHAHVNSTRDKAQKRELETMSLRAPARARSPTWSVSSLALGAAAALLSTLTSWGLALLK